jgi:hypothetical protein
MWNSRFPWRTERQSVDRIPIGRVLLLLVGALSLAAIVLVVATSASLPPRVATHFGAGGLPDGWMTREGYVAFMLAFAVLLPWAVFAAIGLLPARWLNIPGRGVAIAPANRDAALALTRRFAMGLAASMIALSAATHVAILAAHRRTPPQLDEGPFLAVVVLFVAGLVVASFRYNRLYKRLAA